MSAINFYSRSVSPNHKRQIWRFHMGQCQTEALQSIFTHLTYNQLRRCMLVSKFWRKSALEELQARCSVKICSEEDAKNVSHKLNASSHLRIGNLRINSISLECRLLHQLFSKVCHTLHFLKIESPIEIEGGMLLKALDKLPNLTHFSVTALQSDTSTRLPNGNETQFMFPILSDEYSEDGQLSKETQDVVHKNIRHLHLDLGPLVTFQLTRIFNAFPNLYELAISNVIDEPRKRFKSASATSTGAHSLKHLTIRQYSKTSFTEKVIQTLIRLNLHLSKLNIIFHPPSSQSGSSNIQTLSSLLRQFIELQEGLESLKLLQVEDDLSWTWKNAANGDMNPTTLSPPVNYSWNFNYSSPSISLLPVSLPNLQILHVQKPLITNLAQVLNHFPQLRELSIQVSQGSNWKGMLPSRLEPHANIAKLKIDFIDCESFTRLGRCLPFLQTLQLAYCDKSLFNVLADFIPYFNKGGSATGGKDRISKENVFSCHQCHGIIEQVPCEEKRKIDGIIEDNECFMKGSGVVLPNYDGRSGKEATAKPQQRKKHVFKYFRRLVFRTCAHVPFESYVFLPRERPYETNQNLKNSDLDNFDESFENELDGAQEVFSWAAVEALEDEKFADLPITSIDDDCSSA